MLYSYTYTGDYTPAYVYDSISLSVSDGTFEAGPIDLAIRIRATKGRTNPAVRSQHSLNAEFMGNNEAHTDAFLSDAASEPESRSDYITPTALISVEPIL